MTDYQQGIQLQKQNKWQEAYRCFERGAGYDIACRIKQALCLLNGQGVDKDLPRAVSILRECVAQDNAEARLHLGNLYFAGVGVEKNPSLAIELVQESAFGGCVPAMIRLGVWYMDGAPTLTTDPAVAVQWIEKAVSMGSGEACNVLGVWCIAGRGIERNPLRARELFERASEAGVLDGTFNLSMTYFDGSCDDRDFVKSTALLLDAAQKGYVRAYQMVGTRYLNGIGVAPNPQEGRNWLYRSACAGDPEGENLYGTLLLQGVAGPKDVASARLWFEKAAAKGHAGACNNLGVCYLDGMGGDKDEAKAVQLFDKARQSNNPDGFFNLGLCQMGARGTEKDAAKAYQNFCEAAKRGHRSAPAHVGECLVKGLGTPADPEKGCTVLREAALRGERTAMFFYGMCLLEGTGCFADEKEGLRYLQKAADKGYLPAKKELEKREASMPDAIPSEQTDKAEALAKSGDKVGAVDLWKNAADSGDSAACYKLGNAYLMGDGVKQDYDQAAVWYERSVAKGNIKAQCALAGLLWAGQGTQQNRLRAVKLWQQCALLGMRDAALRLAQAYQEGFEGKPDGENCFHWAKVAAEKGDKQACLLLAHCYRTGFGCAKDPEAAAMWQAKAE